MDRFSKTPAKKKKNIADIMAIYYKQDMDTQLKTLIIRNFKCLHPTDLKILVITFKLKLQKGLLVILRQSLFCRVLNHIQLFLKPNLNLEIMQ